MAAWEALGADDPVDIGSYRLLGILGTGGMGRVYLGRSPGGRLVAVKVVHRHLAADQRFRARFASEVSAARLVSGEAGGNRTAPVLAAEPEAEVPWVATGYVAGSDLADVVQEHGPLPERTVRALGSGLAEALGAVHAQGLVHRDVKPSNVLLALDGPHLIDFGITRAAESATHLTTTGVVVGSPGFMAPEQVTGETAVSSATDVFSLGALLAYAAAGRLPFPGTGTAQLLYRVVHTEPELDEVAPDSVRELIAACLAKDPAARPTLPEVVRLLDGEPSPSPLWLPPEVADAIGRRAVELLQLESGPAAPAPAPPAPPSVRPPEAVTVPAPAPPVHAPEAVTVRAPLRPVPPDTPAAARTAVRTAVLASRKPPAPPVPEEPPGGPSRKPGLWLGAGACVLLASVFTTWIMTQHGEPAPLPEAFIGRWNDAKTGYDNRLELTAGNEGNEVGTLVADIDDEEGSATCQYRLTLDRMESDGAYAHLKGTPTTSDNSGRCTGELRVSLQRMGYKGDRGENVLQFSAGGPVVSLGTLWQTG
ncbi:serine/threonine protein kinase [Streptomyces sp. OfavH-34-F]|uniref:serine/threonine-protein kinase n=1 Tax=Streptomyces sp. OfavH-34-F TaxID=2917760 RepID=UPI001EF320B0|nr:serine/threonine-protein kinase [Streptomyces sp. OfavH-34-F]MCG7526498.1 serine/threonine protein kinase [Streptomyces sp. OfavH-34-F]